MEALCSFVLSTHMHIYWLRMQLLSMRTATTDVALCTMLEATSAPLQQHNTFFHFFLELCPHYSEHVTKS